MDVIIEYIKTHPVQLAFIFAGAIIILFVLVFTLAYKYSNISKKYFALVGDEEDSTIEDILLKNNEVLKEISETESELINKLEELESKFSLSVQNVGIIRYNAFGELGPELSFSMALLDEYLNGIVITSIHGRQQSSCYGKSITKGKSDIPLSVEEEQAINKAVKGQFYSNSI